MFQAARILGVRALGPLATLLALLALSPNAHAGDPADDLKPQHDPGVLPPDTTSNSMLLTGAALTVGWYGAAVGTSYLWQDSPGAKDLRIPVAGPVLALAKTGCSDEEDCNAVWVVFRTILSSLSAVGQVGGVAVMAEALFLPRAASERQASARVLPARGDRPGIDAMSLVPVATDASVGLSFSAQF
jgi:hypothetical protein